jgi:uncharacterized repeat protein (TIGR03803 family)
MKNHRATAVFGITAMLAPALARAQSYSFQILANFDSSSGENPLAGLTADRQGNFFGVTQFGGHHNDGTIFELPVGGNTPIPLASFNGVNGANPNGAVVVDAHGNVFGTAPQGGANNVGTAFELAAGSNTITVLAAFNGANGAFPQGGLITDGQGNLFGTTQNGGSPGQGNIVELPAGSNTINSLTTFASGTGPRIPEAGLLEDSHGNLFGTGQVGGANNDGAIFELPAGSNTPLVLANFNGANGAFPQAELISDGHGNLFGTTTGGGPGGAELGAGLVFELASGSNTLTTVALFNSATGSNPFGNLYEDSHGNLFGTTNLNGANGDGTVFEMPAGSSTPVVLMNFNGSNGEFPEAGLIADGQGDLFGITPGGGASNQGAIFELSPTPTWISAASTEFSWDGRDGALVATGAVTISGSPGSKLVALAIGSGGSITIATGVGQVNATTLTEVPHGTLDIQNNRVVIHYLGGSSGSPALQVIPELAQGQASGWTGPGGIVSTTAAHTPGYAVGFQDDGSGQITLAYALYGDINLDGVVNGTDFGVLAANFGRTVTGGWEDGDLNYGGTVNGSDFALLAENFGKSANGAAISVPASEWAALDAFAAAHGLLADVPEPTTAASLVLTGCLMLRRRRVRRGGD